MNDINKILKYHQQQNIPTATEVKKETVRNITWQKWFDPLGSDIEESEWPGAVGTMKDDKIKKRIEELEEEIINLDDEEEDGEWSEDHILDPGDMLLLNKHQYQQERPKPIAGMVTQMGIIPMTEHTRAGSIFNFWTAHTNFRMTQEVFKIIDNTDGVETFDVYTPYRWRVAIGKGFNSQEVKSNIAKNLEATCE